MASARPWRPQIVKRTDAARSAEQHYREHLLGCPHCVVRQPIGGATIVDLCRIGNIYANSVAVAFRWARK